MITENEAIKTSLAVTTAMINNDKMFREMVYGDLEADELKRVLRWTTRLLIQQFAANVVVTGGDVDNLPKVWQEWSMLMSDSLEENK